MKVKETYTLERCLKYTFLYITTLIYLLLEMIAQRLSSKNFKDTVLLND